MTATPLARCVFPGCPVRFRSGPDHPCADHGRDDWAIHDAARQLGIDLQAVPGQRSEPPRRVSRGQYAGVRSDRLSETEAKPDDNFGHPDASDT